MPVRRRDLWTFLFLLALPRPVLGQLDRDLALRALAFEKHWNPFLRRLFGCREEGDTNPDTCQPAVRGKVDFQEFARAREAAKGLFDLKEA